MHLFQKLDTDWQRLIAGGEARRACLRWNRQDPVLANVTCPDDLVMRIRTCGEPATSDALLSALVRRASTDEIAARTILQALVPGMRCLARKLAGLGDAEDVDATIVACAWERIRTYPHDRRPRHVAANVLLDTRKGAARTLRRNDRQEVVVANLPDKPCEPIADHGLAECLRQAVALSLISLDEALLISSTRIDSTPLATLAAQRSTSANTLGKRRSRAERRLRMVKATSSR